MKSVNITYRLFGLLVLFLLAMTDVKAQDTLQTSATEPIRMMGAELRSLDSIEVNPDFDADVAESIPDSVIVLKSDSVALAIAEVDSIISEMSFDTERWIPDPKKAMWLAIVFPGGGQIYNRKYWKLPIVYGGLLGCVYALNWNNTMYSDYSQAYIDIMDDDPNTKSYENFIPPSYDIDKNMTRMQELFKRKKNYYRRYRDLSIFCMIGVYALSILDAYVDAELSSFDISRDLSMKVKPTIISDKSNMVRGNVIKSNSYGLQCSFNF